MRLQVGTRDAAGAADRQSGGRQVLVFSVICQIRAVLSSPAVASLAPSWSNATPRLEPLEPCQGVMAPWPSQCRICGNQVAPLLNNIKKGQHGCKWCSGRAVDPAEAAEVMRAAGLEPLAAYPGAHSPWPCRCQRCHETVTPRYRAVQGGSGYCYCNDTAINPEAAASLMRAAGREPLGQYPGSLHPWTCRCARQ
jgi:hypothetical protein